MAVLAIGVACIDITIEIEEKLRENRKYRCTDRTISGGGPAFNAACLCTMWQEETYLLSRIGRDEYGRQLLSIADNIGLHVLGSVDERFETAYSYIVSSKTDGSRTVFNFPCKEPLERFIFPKLPIRFLLSDGHLPVLTLKALEEFPNARLVVDADVCNEQTLTICKLASWIICSEEFAKGYLHEPLAVDDLHRLDQQFETIRQLNGKELLITIGDRGVICKQQEHLEIFPAYKVEAVDTCGAGDLFHGAFVWCLDHQLSLPECLQIASMASAISVTRKGTQSSIPTLSEVQAKLSEIQAR